MNALDENIIKEIRKDYLNKDIPIVDQEVYDTKEGWIQHITSKGVKDFDQYIAINQRIKEIFIIKK